MRRLKRTRDNKKVKYSLDKLRDEADRERNLMPTIIEAVKAYATLGEMCDVLRGVFGECSELIVF